jgi:iodothyronine deiodinase-like protein
VPALNALYREYNDRAAFYIVYIQEAHPIDGWQMEANITDDVLVASTKTHDDRCAAAGSCVVGLGIEIPAIIDSPDSRVDRAYSGWPDRLYVIDREGRIAFKSDPGPFGFKPAAVKASLERLLS